MTQEAISPKLQLSITEAAAHFFEEKIAEQSASAIHLSVKKSGCTGYGYVIDAVNEPQEGDIELTLQGITFYVSKLASAMINGSEIDFVTKGLSKTIEFNNPNVTISCGCGSSFSVE